MIRIKRFNFPAFTDQEWTTLNPSLKKGEFGIEINSEGIAEHIKVGPGQWNDLPYLDDSIYITEELVANEIGDAKGDLNGLSIQQILKLMLNPYQVPALSNVKNNASGSYANAQILEIGNGLQNNLKIQYSISSPENLDTSTPINVSAGAVFNNEGYFLNSGTITLNLDNPFAPASLYNLVVAVFAKHKGGNSAVVNTTVKWSPRIFWGLNNKNQLLTGPEVLALSDGGNLLTDNYKQDFSFSATGRPWLAVPTMLLSDPDDLTFTNVFNPNLPSPMSFIDMGVLNNMNNGVGIYGYRLFMNENEILSPVTVRVS